MVRTRRHHDSPNQFEHVEGLRSDYAAAKSNRYRRRRTGTAAGGSHADFHYRSDADYLRVMEDARDMERNDGIVGRLLDAATDCTLLHGIDVDPATKSTKFNAALKAKWWNWAEDPESCDASGEQTFYQMQKSAFRQMMLDGDIVAVLTDEGSMWHFEAHRVRTPTNSKRNIVHGVELDERRRRVRYWVTKEDLDPQVPLKLVSQATPYEVRDESGMRILLHLYKAKRFTQTRGVSHLAPVFDALGMLEDIEFAALVKQQGGVCYAFIHNRGENWEPAPFASTTGEGSGGDEAEELRSRREREEPTAPGMHVYGEKGEEINLESPNIPGDNYFQHMRATLQKIAVNFGVPLIIALMDGSETNFSGGRMAVDAAKNVWRSNQNLVCVQYVVPTYRWKVAQFMAEDEELRQLAEAEGVEDPYAHNLKLPAWPYIQPLQDVGTDVLRLRHRIASPQEIAAERNQDAEQIQRECIKHSADGIRKAMEEADKLNEGVSDPANKVHWRDLYQLAPPEGVQVSINATAGDGQTSNASGGGKPNAA